MKQVAIIIGLWVGFVFLGTGGIIAADWDHSIRVDKMEFHWKIQSDTLLVKLAAKTNGWLGIGFNPIKEQMMRGANIIIGYVKDDEVMISDDYGDRRNSHVTDERMQGDSHVSTLSGSEINGMTTLMFSLPLNSGDKFDTVIDPLGNTTIILAYGARDSFRMGHKYSAILQVNLTSGEHKIIE